MWDMDTGAQIGEPLKGHSSEVVSVSFSPDNTRIVSASRDNTIRVWEAHSGIPIGEPSKGQSHWVYSAALSPDGASIISGSWDCTIRTWKAPKPIKQFEKASIKMVCGPSSIHVCALKSDSQRLHSLRNKCSSVSYCMDVKIFPPLSTLVGILLLRLRQGDSVMHGAEL